METSSPPLVEPLATRDGCDCPPFVSRCAHLPDGNLLRLSDHSVAVCPCSDRLSAQGYRRVRYSVGQRWRHEPCLEAAGFWHSRGKPEYQGDDYDEALAAFYAAEEALIRGDA